MRPREEVIRELVGQWLARAEAAEALRLARRVRDGVPAALRGPGPGPPSPPGP